MRVKQLVEAEWVPEMSATFTFQIRFTNMLESFSFIKAGEKRAEQPSSSSALHHAGCGARINWSQMRRVSVPLEFQEGTINTTDVSVRS